MQGRTTVLILSLTLSSIGLPRNATAQPLLKVDFGVSGDASPVQPGFIGVAGEVVQTSHFEAIGPYTLSLDGGGFFATGGNSNNIAAGVRNLYRDYYYNNSTVPGDGVILGLGGFTANTQYNVTLWSYDADLVAPFGVSTPTTWDPIGDTTGTSGTATNFGTPYPTTLSDNSTTIQVTSSTGTLEIFGTTIDGNGGTRLNAVRVNDGVTDLLSLDFGRASQPSSPVQATFTGLRGEVAQPNFSQSVGPYTVSLEGQGFFNTTSSNADLVDASVRDFYRDYYYNNAIDPGLGVELTIEGVTPNQDYDLTLWSYDADNFSPTPTTWTPVGTTTGEVGNVTNAQDPYPTSLADNSTTIRVRSTTSTLVVFGTTTEGTGGTRLNGFELSKASTGPAGDYNGNGTVDGADYSVWRDTLGSTTNLTADGSGNSVIDQADYDLWKQNFGNNGSGNSLGTASVPEPTSMLLLMVVLSLVSTRPLRKRINSRVQNHGAPG
jgi:hypothetical protein